MDKELTELARPHSYENEALSNLEVSTEQPPSTDIISRTISSSSLLTTVDQLQNSNIYMPITSAASSFKNTSSDVPSPIEKATSFLTNSLIKHLSFTKVKKTHPGKGIDISGKCLTGILFL